MDLLYPRHVARGKLCSSMWLPMTGSVVWMMEDVLELSRLDANLTPTILILQVWQSRMDLEPLLLSSSLQSKCSIEKIRVKIVEKLISYGVISYASINCLKYT